MVIQQESEPLLSGSSKPKNGQVYVDEVRDVNLQNSGDTESVSEALQLGITTEWSFSKPSMVYVVIIAMMVAISRMFDAFQEIIYFKKACYTNNINGVCNPADNQILVSSFEQVTSVPALIILVFGMMQLSKFCTNYGKRPVFLILFSLGFISNVFLYFIISTYPGFKFKLYAVQSITANIFGGIFGFVPFINAYITDFAPAERRTSYFSTFMAFLQLGNVLSPMLANFTESVFKHYMTSKDPYNMVLVVQMFIVVIFIAFIYFFVPESATITNTIELSSQESSDWFSINHLTEIISLTFGPMKVLAIPKSFLPREMQPHLKSIRVQTLSLIFIMVMSTAVAMGTSSILIDFAIFKFDIDGSDLNNLIMVLSSSSFFVLFFAIPSLSGVFDWLGIVVNPDKIDLRDIIMLLLGFISDFFLFFCFAYAPNLGSLMFLFSLSGFGSIIRPTISSVLAKFYPSSKVAELFLAIASITNCLCVILMPAVLQIYKFGMRNDIPSLAFNIVSGNYVIFLIIVLVNYGLVVCSKPIKLSTNDEEEA